MVPFTTRPVAAKDLCPPPGSAKRRPTGILIADDQGLILTLLKLALEPQGFAVWLVTSGREAIDTYRQHKDEIDLVLMDVHMPEMDGSQTLIALQAIDPYVLACFMTGDPGQSCEVHLLRR